MKSNNLSSNDQYTNNNSIIPTKNSTNRYIQLIENIIKNPTILPKGMDDQLGIKKHLIEALKLVDSDKLKKVIEIDWQLFQYVPELYKNDQSFCEHALEQSGKVIQYFSSKHRSDSNMVMKAVTQNGRALQHLNDYYRGHYQVVTDAINQNPAAIQYASEGVRNNKNFLMNQVLHGGNDKNLSSYLDSIEKYKIIDNNSFWREYNLRVRHQYCEGGIIDDGTKIKMFLHHKGFTDMNLCEFYNSIETKKDAKELFGPDYKHKYGDNCSDEAQYEYRKKCYTFIVKKYPDLLEYGLSRIKSDEKIMREILKDEKIMREILEKDGLALKYAAPEIRDEKEFVDIAVKQNPEAEKYASDRVMALKNQHSYMQEKRERDVEEIIETFSTNVRGNVEKINIDKLTEEEKYNVFKNIVEYYSCGYLRFSLSDIQKATKHLIKTCEEVRNKIVVMKKSDIKSNKSNLDNNVMKMVLEYKMSPDDYFITDKDLSFALFLSQDNYKSDDFKSLAYFNDSFDFIKVCGNRGPNKALLEKALGIFETLDYNSQIMFAKQLIEINSDWWYKLPQNIKDHRDLEKQAVEKNQYILPEVLNANNMDDLFKQVIKNAQNNGQPLSEFIESVLLGYNWTNNLKKKPITQTYNSKDKEFVAILRSSEEYLEFKVSQDFYNQLSEPEYSNMYNSSYMSDSL